jgi:hypothetical protein
MCPINPITNQNPVSSHEHMTTYMFYSFYESTNISGNNFYTSKNIALYHLTTYFLSNAVYGNISTDTDPKILCLFNVSIILATAWSEWEGLRVCVRLVLLNGR